MFEKILRFTMKNEPEYDKKMIIFNQDYLKIGIIVALFCATCINVPAAIIYIISASLIPDELWIWNIVILVSLIIVFIFIFNKLLVDTKMKTSIVTEITDRIYGKLYSMSGKAITNKDFDILKAGDSDLYNRISTCKCAGKCYSTCFRLLKTLKKGEMTLVAIRVAEYEKREERHQHFYTMHAIYVYNNWCFDSFSGKQIPLDTFLETLEGIVYKTFKYNDISKKDLKTFQQDENTNIVYWCKKHDCELFWNNI